jgi:hypothetical protein
MAAAERARDRRLEDVDWLRAEYAVRGALDIARELGCSHHAVYAALRAASIPVRRNGTHVGQSRSAVPAHLVEPVVARYVSGSTAEQVAGDFDLTVKAVTQFVEGAYPELRLR